MRSCQDSYNVPKPYEARFVFGSKIFPFIGALKSNFSKRKITIYNVNQQYSIPVQLASSCPREMSWCKLHETPAIQETQIGPQTSPSLLNRVNT